jgi:hypothetical protein
MSRTAKALFELKRIAQGHAGALTDHLIHEVAASLIAGDIEPTNKPQRQGSPRSKEMA